jgi:plasmid stability protein
VRRLAIIASNRSRESIGMANLVVRNLDARIVDALEQWAAWHGRSTQAEHRALLEEALLKPRLRPFAGVLANMPDLGEDEASAPGRVYFT